MRVFVTGATGYIGTSLVKALVRAGHDVTGLMRDEAKTKGLPAVVRWVKGDLKEPATYANAAKTCEASIHLGFEYGANAPSVDKTSLETLLGAARDARAPRTVVYTSGIWVLGATGDAGADETAGTDKAFPLVAWRPGHERTALEALSSTLVSAVVRPGIVVGGRGGIAGRFFEAAEKDGTVTYVGDGKNRWSPVHVDDLADLYVRLVELAPARLAGLPAKDRVFHAVDGTAERVSEIARAVSEAAGKGGKTRSLPLDEARKTMGPFADALALDQVVKTASSERLLGWRPRYRGFVRNAPELQAQWSKARAS